MFERDISTQCIEKIIQTGEIIEEYPKDKPYPSFLILGYCSKRPIHIVYSKDLDGNYILITAYEPIPDIWEESFKKRK
jgi:hypothetical protein